MEFSLSEEQKLIIDTTKKFVETELFPHEELVEKNELFKNMASHA